MSFRFKKFSVNDSRCAMKVGTDGVLLGAWVDTISDIHPIRVLDVGTGSGLVALMLAQRTENALITAIDIDKDAIEQATENFNDSPWKDRLRAECISMQVYSETCNDRYDIIVSNPPYFDNSLKTPDPLRTMARHTDSLSFEELVLSTAKLLKDNGVFCLILPACEEKKVELFAKESGLILVRVCRVRGRADRPIKRTLFSFRKQCTQNSISPDFLITEENLILEQGHNSRTKQYSNLMSEFYL